MMHSVQQELIQQAGVNAFLACLAICIGVIYYSHYQAQVICERRDGGEYPNSQDQHPHQVGTTLRHDSVS